MALKMDEIMDLSLDDYIAISKKCTNNVTNKRPAKDTFDNCIDKDTKFGRRKGNIDDEEAEEEDDDDLLMQTAKEELEKETHSEDIQGNVWKGPDSSISYIDCQEHKNDLRGKLSNNKRNSWNISSVQYRMMAPNTAANRPRGIPTLLPLDVEVNNRNWRRNGGKRRYNCHRGFNNNTAAKVGGANNGRVQRNRNQDIDSKNLRFNIIKNNNSRNNINGQTHPQNMFIETPSTCINLYPSRPLKSSFLIPQHAASEQHFNNRSTSLPIGNFPPQPEAVLNLNTMTSQRNSPAVGNNNESLKSLLGFQGNVSGEMMPIFATRLMEYIQSGLQNQVMHKPLYDMKIQKEIHEIQQKPLLYKCPGGEVVSSDGSGVNCKIIPRTSGLSLNCRFA